MSELQEFFNDMIELVRSGKQGQIRWFTRKYEKLAPADQQELLKQLEARGLKKPERKKKYVSKSRTTYNRISWTDEEWDKLTSLVWTMRKNRPETLISELARRAQEQFPEDRRRDIRLLSQLKPLTDRISHIDASLEELAEKAQKYENKPEQPKMPTKDEILSSLTDEEAMVFFGDRIIANISPDDVIRKLPTEALIEYIPVGQMASYLFNGFINSFIRKLDNSEGLLEDIRSALRQAPEKPSKPNIPYAREHFKPQLNNKGPKVTVIGLLSEQQQTVENKLKGRATFHFIDKNRSDIPTTQDFLVIMCNFVSHSVQDHAKKKLDGSKVILHHGGTTTLINKLDKILPNLVKV